MRSRQLHSHNPRLAQTIGHRARWFAVWVSVVGIRVSESGFLSLPVQGLRLATLAMWSNKSHPDHSRGETIHRYIGASRYFVYDTIHWYKYENIDTKRYDFAVKDTRATWRMPREVVNATLASLVQHTHHVAEQRSWISVIFTIGLFQRKRCNVLWRTGSLGNVGM